MTELLVSVIKCLSAVLVGIFAGNGAVYCFNHMPAQWFCDYGEKPTEEMLDTYTQRVKSYPWKFILTMFFVVIDIKLVMDDWQFAVGAVCAIWLLVELSMADLKYRIVPDQLVILLAVSALGFIPYHGSWTDCLWGGLTGFGIMGFTALLGKMTYRRETLGGGDIKLFASLGLISGLTGILIIFALTALISGGHLVWLLVRKKIKKNDTVPMVPYIAIASVIYFVFFWGYEQILFL